MKLLLTLPVCCLLSIFTFGQKLIVTDIQVKEQVIIVSYNLEELPPGNELQVQLFSSIDNFISPLKKVSGDIGSTLEAGYNKSITWNYAEEYPGYSGKISVEVRGKAFIPVARFRNVTGGTIYKRGNNYGIDWKPGNNKVVDIEVYQGSNRVQGESNINNSGNYNLQLLPTLKPGNNYRIKISDSRNPEEYVYSESFTVKRKIPLLVKAVPIAIIGILGVYTILNTSSAEKTSEIPGVPGLPGGN